MASQVGPASIGSTAADAMMEREFSLTVFAQGVLEFDNPENFLMALGRRIEGADGHCDRVSERSAVLGARLGLDPGQLLALRVGGFIHDIGKFAIPKSLLLKPGKLTAAEWNLMRLHTVIGERMCAPISSLRHVLPIVRHHHEKMDGSGYPDGLRGREVPLTARVLQIVDVYDALTSERSYKVALKPANALEIMHSEVGRGWWDTDVFQEFVFLAQQWNQG